MTYRLLYFASLADRAGCAEEVRDSAAGTPRDLYAEVAAAHRFPFAADRLRVAVNGAFVAWDHALSDRDEVVFLPPVSGG
ncbi:MoaD/ThiS family protein [Dokdonella sp.]|uniref:MoaD/ThiS family protein n=1 Tax=Dokdonella sp. TaxID=2291710 RepID=UPI001B0A5EF1|nr:MoaD/ThiS family protein [Dokdonella sp.]MBO9664152.1 MoaD/ThiS family protein [Dokdonella sp.]